MVMTEFNIDIAKEVWQEEAYADACEEFRDEIAAKDAEIAAQAAENARLSALVAELQAES